MTSPAAVNGANAVSARARRVKSARGAKSISTVVSRQATLSLPRGRAPAARHLLLDRLDEVVGEGVLVHPPE